MLNHKINMALRANTLDMFTQIYKLAAKISSHKEKQNYKKNTHSSGYFSVTFFIYFFFFFNHFIEKELFYTLTLYLSETL